VRSADLMGDLLSASRVGQIFSYTTFRDSKAAFNETRTYEAQTQALTATKIAFIGSSGTASASELVMNSFLPYLGANVALVGTNTYGKPVGQIGLDQTACDDRLRVVAFKTENANRQGEYFTGMASVMPVTCRASDDIFRQLGDPAENSLSTALSWLRGGSCTAISGGGITTQAAGGRSMLLSERPSAAQHEVPGMF
jgi:carboxyl-terminal processing protease